MNHWKSTDLTVKNTVSTDDSVKRQITDSISEKLTDSDLESILNLTYQSILPQIYRKIKFYIQISMKLNNIPNSVANHLKSIDNILQWLVIICNHL